MSPCVECSSPRTSPGTDRSPGYRVRLSPPAAALTTTWTRSPISTRPARPALRLRPRLVNDEIAIPEEPTVQHLDRLGGLFLRGHLDEPEAARPARELVGDDPHGLDGSRLGEQLAEILLGGLKGEVAYEQLCGHHDPPSPNESGGESKTTRGLQRKSIVTAGDACQGRSGPPPGGLRGRRRGSRRRLP